MKTNFKAFLLTLIFVLVAQGSPQAANLELSSLKPPVLLPDGSEFKTWEKPLKFTRTYYVDGSSPNASDENPGTADKPFATINKVAQVLEPGERVIVAAGVYRERIKPARGGTEPGKMISYEAAPGARVILKGSRIFKPDWRLARTEGQMRNRLWFADLPARLFDSYNPFNIENVTAEQFEVMDWATPLRGKVPYTLVRGMLFQDGKLMTQCAKSEDIFHKPGTWWLNRALQIIVIHPFEDKDPVLANFEITTQETIFAPDQIGLGFIRVKGFVVEHSAGPWPWEQVGAISTWRGHHWIIEDNTVRWANGVGIDLGSQHPRFPQPDQIGFHIVRRNIVNDCGICGICGLGRGRNREFGLLVEDNVLLRNSFYDVERLYETGGIKTHNNIRCLIRRNFIMETQHGAGIWMDWDNQFSRCCQNVIIGNKTIHGGIFVEASYQPNLVDQNFIWGTEGHGIYEHDSREQMFVNNFIAYSSRAPMHLHGKITDRRVGGRPIVGGRHFVANNICFANKGTNVFLGEPSEVVGNFFGPMNAQFDAANLQLTWSVQNPKIECPPQKLLTHDFFGRRRSQSKFTPGPFAGALPSRPVVLKLWPINPQAPRLLGKKALAQ